MSYILFFTTGFVNVDLWISLSCYIGVERVKVSMPYGSVVPLAIFTLLFRASKWNVFPVSFLPPTAADLLNYWTIKYFTLNKTNWKTFPCFMRNFPCGRKPDVSINYHRKRGKRERVFFDFPLLASQDIAKTNFYLRRLRVWLSLLRFYWLLKACFSLIFRILS